MSNFIVTTTINKPTEAIYKFSKKRDIENIFFGHHLDDLNETYFLRKTQQSGATGLSNIFLDKYKSLKLHRPLKKHTKKT